MRGIGVSIHQIVLSLGRALLRFSTKYEWVCLIGLTPLMLFPERFSAWSVSGALGLYGWLLIARWLENKQLTLVSPLSLPLVCLLLTVPLSLWASIDFATSLPKLTGLLFGIAICQITLRLSLSPSTFWSVVALWWGSGLVVAFLGFVGTDWTSKAPQLLMFTSRLPRAIGGLTRTGGINPNELGGVLTFFIPAFASVLWFGWRTHVNAPEAAVTGLRRWLTGWILFSTIWGKLLWVLSFGVFVTLLILAQSRSAIFGVVCGLGLLAIVRSRFLRWTVVGVVILFMGVLFVRGTSIIPEIFVELFNAHEFESRIEIWNRSLYAVQDFPFTGLGLNQFNRVTHLLYPYFTLSPDVEVPHAHNIYLQIANDLGLGGLVAYCALLTVAGLSAAKAYRILPNPLEQALVLGFACGLLAHQIYGLSDAITLGAKPSFEWWWLIGMIVSLSLRSSSEVLKTPRWRLSAWDVWGLWLLVLLIAVTGLEYSGLLGVVIAIIGGCVVGLGAVGHFMQVHKTLARQQTKTDVSQSQPSLSSK